MKIVNFIKHAAHAVLIFCRRHAPEICAIAGAGTFVAAEVVTAKKSADYYEEARHIDEERAIRKADAEDKYETEYSEVEFLYDNRKLKLKKAKLFFKQYWLPIVLTIVACGLIFWSNTLFRKQLAIATAATAAVSARFAEYRKRVIEHSGQAADDYLMGKGTLIEEKTELFDEDGNKVETVSYATMTTNPIKVIFCAGCHGKMVSWTGDPFYDIARLRNIENYVNALLKKKGVVLLNDIFDMLGLPRTAFGSENGWFFDLNDPTRLNYIDFGVYDIDQRAWKDPNIPLKFYVDGKVNQLL